MKYLPLLVLFACAIEPESQADKEYRVQIEIERVEAYAYWAKSCPGIIYTYNPSRPCRQHTVEGRRFCVPHKWDWDISGHNNTICASRIAIREAFGR